MKVHGASFIEGTRRGFRDETNADLHFVTQIDRTLDGSFFGLTKGAFMKN